MISIDVEWGFEKLYLLTLYNSYCSLNVLISFGEVIDVDDDYMLRGHYHT